MRSGRARAVREHGHGRDDHAGDVRPARLLRRACDVRGRAALGDRRRGRGHGARRGARCRHAAADAAAPRDHRAARDLTRKAPAPRQRAPLTSILRDRPEPRRRRRSGSSPSARRPRDGDVARSCARPQADLAQLAGSSRESASRFLAVLDRAGVISQGRGRLTIHDPDGAGSAMSSETPSRRRGKRFRAREFSAGGVVDARATRSSRSCRRRTRRRRLEEFSTLPKGHVDPGEKPDRGGRARGHARRQGSSPSR